MTSPGPRRGERRRRLRHPVAVAVVVSLVASLAVLANAVRSAPPAAATQLSLPVSVNQMMVDDPTRWTPARGYIPAHPGRSLRTLVFYPSVGGPYPLIVFAHGYNITPEAYGTLLGAIAASGYVVAAPEFPISSSGLPGPPGRYDLAQQPGDLSAVMSAVFWADLDPTSFLNGRVIGGPVGVMGHSDGGLTAAAISLNSATLDPRVGATAVLSGGEFYISGGSWGPFNSGPMLVVHGDSDPIDGVWNGQTVFDEAASPKAFLHVVGGGHISPYIDPGLQPDLVRASIAAFFDANLRHDPGGLSRLDIYGNQGGLTYLVGSDFPPNPIGAFEGTSPTWAPGTVVSGWALDPDTTGPIQIYAFVDGILTTIGTADRSRPEIAAAYPGFGPGHGFAFAVPLASGSHQVCLYAINVGGGTVNPGLGCRQVSTDNPVGSLDGVAVTGFRDVSVTGWAVDPNTSGPIDVHVYVDGQFRGARRANLERADLGALLPAFGTNHGFSVSLAGLAGGTHQVCVYGINVGAGDTNTSLGCGSVVLPGGAPIGGFDAVTTTAPGSIQTSGWALDPDTASPIAVDVFVDGAFVKAVTADGDRPEVGAAYPAYGSGHGFSTTLDGLRPGSHNVCAYAVNAVDASPNSLLGCGPVLVPGGSPFGAVDSATKVSASSLRVSGWAIDPDTVATVAVRVFVDGIAKTVGVAASSRPDVGSLFPAYGPLRGYSFDVGGLSAGAHTVCVTGIDIPGTAPDQSLGCLAVTL